MNCQGQDECFQIGECTGSYLFDATYVLDEYHCLDLCESTEKCTWSTYYQNLGLCELLYNCPGLAAEKCPDCLSSPVGCTPPTPQCWIQGQCEGNMISTLPASTQQECLELCKGTVELKLPKFCLWHVAWSMNIPPTKFHAAGKSY